MIAWIVLHKLTASIRGPHLFEARRLLEELRCICRSADGEGIYRSADGEGKKFC